MITYADLLTGWLTHELQQARGFTYDKRLARYRDRETGRLVAERDVIAAADGFRDFARANIDRLTERFVDGDIDLPTWQRRVAQEVKDAHIVSAMAGKGGRNNMTQADWGRVGGRLRFEYDRLNRFAVEVKAGMQTPAQIRARAKLYANGTRKSYFDGKTAACQEAEFTEERRILQPGESCADCIGYAAQGWVPIGTLPEPGVASECLSNCNCIKEYR